MHIDLTHVFPDMFSLIIFNPHDLKSLFMKRIKNLRTTFKYALETRKKINKSINSFNFSVHSAFREATTRSC